MSSKKGPKDSKMKISKIIILTDLNIAPKILSKIKLLVDLKEKKLKIFNLIN
jgi:hypothetical protein